ncbi:MFS transporter [Candidatus Woesearchaeota archaeon]|nr:MFS transporter [Candidatus Woesearchaeota archaeon]
MLKDMKSKNIHIMFALYVIGGLMFFLPVLALYYEESLFTATNVAIIFAVSSVSFALFEIPTGAISDLFGRKRTIVLGNLFALSGLVFLYYGGSMFMFVMYALFNSFGRALMSGTDSALMYDTLMDEKKEHMFKKVIGTCHALWPVGATIGSVLGGYMAAVSLKTPIAYTFIPFGVATLLTLFLKEPLYEKEQHSVVTHMKESFKVIFHNKQVLLLMVGMFILMAFGESIHMLKPLFLEFKDIPIRYFGIIYGFVFGVSAVGHYLSHDVSEKIGDKNTLLVATFTMPLFIILAALFDKYVAIVFLVLSSVPFGLRRPVIELMLNKEVSSQRRATIISTGSFMEQLGLTVFVPIVGYMADIWSINFAYGLSGALMGSVFVLWLWLE